MLVGASTAVATVGRFETRVDLVVMDVCATDRAGRPAGIDPRDLTVLDNGVRQQIALFLPGERIPLAVTLLTARTRPGDWISTRCSTKYGAAAFWSTR